MGFTLQTALLPIWSTFRFDVYNVAFAEAARMYLLPNKDAFFRTAIRLNNLWLLVHLTEKCRAQHPRLPLPNQMIM